MSKVKYTTIPVPTLMINHEQATQKEPREWIIQRCTQRWIGIELQYEDYPVPEGIMTRSDAKKVLKRVDREDSVNEFRAHRLTASTPSIPKPGLSGRPQSKLDWNTRRKPAITPRREFEFMRHYGMLLAQSVAYTFGPGNGGIIQ